MTTVGHVCAGGPVPRTCLVNMGPETADFINVEVILSAVLCFYQFEKEVLVCCHSGLQSPAKARTGNVHVHLKCGVWKIVLCL